MAYKKLGVTANEMMELRKQGLSNRDIANVLEVSGATVNRYIGAQGCRMESMAAFKDKPKAEETPVETPEIKRAVDEIIIRKEIVCSKSNNFTAEVDYVSHDVIIGDSYITFDALAEYATFVVGVVERIKKGVKQ
jgi:predicted transcriptional regulator